MVTDSIESGVDSISREVSVDQNLDWSASERRVVGLMSVLLPVLLILVVLDEVSVDTSCIFVALVDALLSSKDSVIGVLLSSAERDVLSVDISLLLITELANIGVNAVNAFNAVTSLESVVFDSDIDPTVELVVQVVVVFRVFVELRVWPFAAEVSAERHY